MSWARLDALAGRASSRLFSERVKILPQQVSRVVVGGADPVRPAFDVMATLDVTEHSDHVHGDRSQAGNRQDFIVAEASLLIEAGEFNAVCQAPKVGDRVVAIDRPGSPEFKITTPAAQNGGRHLFMMVAVPV